MSTNSKIEWTDHTFNPWEGCQKVGPGCDHCYAETRNARFGGGVAINWGPDASRRRTSESNWNLPKRWNAQHDAFVAAHGRRQRVFCANLADVFDNAAPAEWRADLFDLILHTPNLDWLLLTKRIGNVGNMLPVPFDFARQYPNVRIGATICNQAEADRDIPKLLALECPNFLSVEPLLGPMDLEAMPFGPPCTGCGETVRLDAFTGSTSCLYGCDGPKFDGINWVIVGGESGPGARPMHPDWARGLRDQCQAAGVPFLFKQWGEWCTHDDMLDETGDNLYTADLSRIRVASTCMGIDGQTSHDIELVSPQGAALYRIGKKAAGRRLDGREWNEVPA